MHVRAHIREEGWIVREEKLVVKRVREEKWIVKRGRQEKWIVKRGSWSSAHPHKHR